jgi:hypothetical protein
MNCLPESGGCERPFTDAFIAYLNEVERSNFTHRVCLDVSERRTAQPEALYKDDGTSKSLVIERKSLPWPLDFVHRHKNDHVAADVVQKSLQGLPTTELYELELPMLISGRQKDVEAFAENAGVAIRRNWSAIIAGRRFKGGQGKMWWRFGRVSENARQEDDPACGIKITWTGPSMVFEDYLDPEHLPEELVAKIQKIYTSCTAKFSSYEDARRILVIDPLEDLRYKDNEFWSLVFKAFPPPAAIDEIWSGFYDLVTDTESDWTFKCLYGISAASQGNHSAIS